MPGKAAGKPTKPGFDPNHVTSVPTPPGFGLGKGKGKRHTTLSLSPRSGKRSLPPLFRYCILRGCSADFQDRCRPGRKFFSSQVRVVSPGAGKLPRRKTSLPRPVAAACFWGGDHVAEIIPIFCGTAGRGAYNGFALRVRRGSGTLPQAVSPTWEHKPCAICLP